MREYIVSIIIPTYNSQKTLEMTLQSIKKQTLDQTEIEILVIDGGSSDNTLALAQKYGAKVLKNDRKLPEFAKQLGLLHAKGKYGVFLDSDESLLNMESLEKRVYYLNTHNKIKNIVSTGQKCKKNEVWINRYANFIGDPFSNFVYRYNGYNRLEDLTKQYHWEKDEEFYLFSFGEGDRIPLFDALGNMFDLEYANMLYIAMGKNPNFAANIFSNMVTNTKCVAVMENDFIMHMPGMTIKDYLHKLTWRVKNNLFQKEGVGFSQRAKKEGELRKRQLLYIPYCILLIPLIRDAIIFSVKNKDKCFLLHVFFAEYIFMNLIWYTILKSLKYPVKMNQTYGKDDE